MSCFNVGFKNQLFKTKTKEAIKTSRSQVRLGLINNEMNQVFESRYRSQPTIGVDLGEGGLILGMSEGGCLLSQKFAPFGPQKFSLDFIC